MEKDNPELMDIIKNKDIQFIYISKLILYGGVILVCYFTRLR
jgi:hypothetical protein